MGCSHYRSGRRVALLLQIYRRQQLRADVIEAFSRQLHSTLDLRELTRLITREAAALTGADGIALGSLAENDLLLISSLSTGPLAALAGQSLPRTVPGDWTIPMPGGHDVVMAPLSIAGTRIGAMIGARARRWRRREVAEWHVLAEKAALALSNAHHYERALARRRSSEELHRFAASAVGELDRQKVFDSVTQRAARMLGADAASFVLSDGPDVVYQSRFGPEVYTPGFRLLARDSIAGRVVLEGRALRIADISKDERYNPERMETATQAVLAVPVSLEDRVLGSLGVLQYAARNFSDDEEEILRQLAAIAASVLRSTTAFEAEQTAHHRFQSLFRTMPEGALLVARDGRIVMANPAAEKLFGSASGLTGSALDRYVVGGDALVGRLFAATSADVPERGRLIRGDGEMREVEWRASPPEANGGHVLCAVRDLTNELTAAAENHTLAAAVRYMRDGVVLISPYGSIEFVNTAAARIHGYASPADLIGRPVDVVVPPEQIEPFAALYGRIRTEGWAGEGRVRHRDGHGVPVQLAISPIHDEGRMLGVVAVIADLTERRAIEQRAAVGEKLATLGRLVAGTAHEINNPLAAILVNAQLALESAPAGDIRGTLDVIVNEARRAGKIVKGMLSFARQRPVTERVFDVRECVADVLHLRRGYHHSLGIEVAADLPAEEVAVFGDPDQMKQVLLNVVVNAEHALRGAAARWLRLRVTHGEGGCRISVEDSGGGVPADLRTRIFEPFFTTKPEGAGSGLGLSVSYGIVKEHGGQIWVESGETGGARFIIALLVDDEETIRSVAQRVLARVGHAVDVAPDGQAALALIQTARYDVILCDIRMPHMSGPELHAELQRRGVLQSTRFVVTTGDIADPETQEFVDAAGAPVLLKPFELTALVNAVG